MVMSETQDYTQTDFALGKLEFDSGLFVLGCTHMTL
jgi:hypothetical protein